MPQVPRFYGIIKYGEYKCQISIQDLSILNGSLPNRAYALVLEWAAMHREELMQNWNLAVQNKPVNQIAPLV